MIRGKLFIYRSEIKTFCCWNCLKTVFQYFEPTLWNNRILEMHQVLWVKCQIFRIRGSDANEEGRRQELPVHLNGNHSSNYFRKMESVIFFHIYQTRNLYFKTSNRAFFTAISQQVWTKFLSSTEYPKAVSARSSLYLSLFEAVMEI